MRILHISSARALGGGERHLIDLTNALAGRGHEVHLALAPRSTFREKFTALPPTQIHTVNLRNALDINSARQLLYIIRERRIEIVHAHLARDYTLAAYATRRARGARFVITRHVLFSLNKLHKFALSNVSRVIAVSAAVEQALLAQKIFPASKIRVVPNGIDVERFVEAARDFDRDSFCRSLGIKQSQLLIGTIGELNQLKGQAEFLRAAAIVAPRFPNASFLIAGRDASRAGEHRARIAQLITRLNLQNRVHLTGWLEDVMPLLSALDVFVSASRTESFGLSIAEAMASGKAIIATATAGAREIIADDATGLLVPIGNIDAMAQALTRLLEDQTARARLGSFAQQAARARFTLARMAQATEEIYEETMNAER